jgi:Protein of unknown function (DUF2919).
MNGYRAEDFDEQGNLRARRGIWLALFLLAHPWWLLAFDMSVEEGSMRVLSVIYPTTESLYTGLVCSVSVSIFLFAYPFRQRHPRLMMTGYLLLIVSSVVLMARVCLELYAAVGGHDEDLWLSLCCLHLACLLGLWPDKRNREACYFQLKGNGHTIKGKYAEYN